MPSTGKRPDFQVTSYENNIFSKLLSSSDTGFKCPNAIIEHLLRRYGIETYSHLIHHTGYTFDWAQRISGIEYLNPDEKPLLSNRGIIRVKSSIASDCLDKTIKLMMLRFQSRINLQEQLEEISQKRSVDLDRFQCLLDSKLVADKQNLMDKTNIYWQTYQIFSNLLPLIFYYHHTLSSPLFWDSAVFFDLHPFVFQNQKFSNFVI